MCATGNHGTGYAAILVENRFIYHEVVILTASIDNTTIHIIINNREMRILAVYKSPKNTLQLADINNLLNSSLPTILAGHLNAKHFFWHNHSKNITVQTVFPYDSITLYYNCTNPLPRSISSKTGRFECSNHEKYEITI